jgi:epoxyqueuosine reductase QueG
MVINKLSQYLVEELRAEGYKAVAPSIDERFRGYSKHNGLPFTSSWSERHVAFISGLGSFGLSKGLITEKGMAGRFGSVVTDAPFEALARKYKEAYEYCIKCGACARRCPAEAITIENGKDQIVCQVYVENTKLKYKPMYGCGKCQVAVPCQSRIPAAK